MEVKTRETEDGSQKMEVKTRKTEESADWDLILNGNF